jgi:beta-barrel assembly-enhancing protease
METPTRASDRPCQRRQAQGRGRTARWRSAATPYATYLTRRLRRLKETQKIEGLEIGAALLLGPSIAKVLAIKLIGDLHTLAYSRDEESQADVTGSDICAAIGYNPWGLVWLFEEFQDADPKQIPQLLSDHPANGTRIKTLEQHFRDYPSVFSKFDSRPESATQFVVPKDAGEQFLRQ